MNILFFSRGYGNMAGGIEKMSLDLARGLSKAGHKVTVISLDSEDAKSFFNWPENVNWLKLGIGSVESKNSPLTRIKRIFAIRKIAKQQNFDVAVGFQVGAFALVKVALLFTSTRVVAAERNAPTLFNYIRFGKIKRIFANLILASADKIAIQFEDYKNYYPRFLHPKLAVTPNWVEISQKIKVPDKTNEVNLLFIGRLSFQKNVEVLINAMQLLPSNFQLTIIGTGPDKENLEKLANSLNLTNVNFRAPTNDVSSELLMADIFCLPSRWEGFPNVIAEALAHGVPCVGFSECAGIPQLIRPGINGVIANGSANSNFFAKAIIEASEMEFKSLKIVRTVENYTYSNYIESWEMALN